MQIIDRAFELLELLSKNKGGYMISELSEKLDVPISSVHRLLSSLKKNNYIVQDPQNKRYKLGLKVLNLAVNLLNNYDIRNIARTYLEALCSKHGEAVFLTIFENEIAVCIDTVMNENSCKFFVRIGREMPIHAAVAGQVILADADEEMIDSVLKKTDYIQYTPYTITDPEKLKQKLKEIKKMGYGICDEELEIGVQAFGVPIRDHSGKAIASITMLRIKTGNNIEKEKLEDLKKTAFDISLALGYRPVHLG